MNQEFDARFETRRVLGVGAMGRVLLAHDRAADREVAVKIASADSAEARWRFRQEFLTMRRLRHPGFVEAFEFGELSDGTLFFTMEALSGATLAKRASPSPEEARGFLIEALRALAFLHANGILHQDLKPENLHVAPSGLKLLDLGLIGRVGEASPGPRGTLRYVAPEVIRGDRLDGRSDLYSLGAVFYHLLAGHPPFDAASPLALLRAHQYESPVPLADCRPDLPLDLARGVMALLAKSPSERPRSAAEVLAELGVREVALGLLHPGIVAREEVLDRLLERLEAPGPLPVRLAIRGPHGSGKTLLLEELRHRRQLQGGEALLLQGGVTTPYGSLAPLNRWLASRLGASEEWKACQAVLEGAVAGIDPLAAQLRMQAAWERLLRAVEVPVVLLVDDWDSVDEASRTILAGLASRQGLSLVLIAAGAPFEVVEELLPFTEGETHELLSKMLGTSEIHPGFVSGLHRRSMGMPGVVQEAVAELTRRGSLVVEGRWRTDLVAQAEIVWSGGAAGTIESLSIEGLRLASILALMRDPGPLSILGACSGLDEATLTEALEELRLLGLVTVGRDGVRLRSPGLREAIRAGLDPVEEKRRHAAIARSFAHQEDRLFEQAHHWRQAGDSRRAAPIAIRAARRLLAAYCLSDAEALLSWALEVRDLDPLERVEGLEVWGDVCRYRADLDRARETYREALAIRESRGLPAAALRVNLCLVEQVRSNFEGARELAEGGLSAARLEGDALQETRALTALARILHLAGADALETARQALDAARRAHLPAFEAEALALLGFLRLGDSSALDEALDCLREALAIRERLMDPIGLNDAYMFIGNAQLAMGQFREARSSFERNLSLCRAVGAARDDEATALVNLAQVQGELGEFEAGLLAIDESIALASGSGNSFLETYALALRGSLRACVGLLAEAQQDTERAHELAATLQSPYLDSVVAAHRSRVLALSGDDWGAVEAAHAGLLKAREHAIWEFEAALAGMLAECYGRLGARGRGRGYALEAERRAAERRANGTRARMQGLLARLTEDETAWRHLEEARALGVPAGMEPLGGELDRVEADLALREGRVSEALRKLRRAHDTALRLGMPLLALEAAQGLHEAEGSPEHGHLLRAAEARGRAIAQRLDPVAREAFEARWFPGRKEEIPSPANGNLAQEMGAVVADFGRLVAGTLSYEEVLDRIIDRVMEITEAERGMILLLEGEGSLNGLVTRPLGESPGLMAFSRSFVETALNERRSIWVADAQSDERFSSAQSVMALDLRTVICVPLVVDGAPLGLLYLDRSSIHHTFRKSDLELVEGLAGFAGLAIANARRHAEARTRSEILAIVQEFGRFTQETDRKAFARCLLEQVSRLSRADHAVLALREPIREVIALDGSPRPEARILEEAEQLAQPLIRLGVPGRHGPESVMVVPLLSGHRLLATLYLSAQDHAFTPEDLAVVEVIATQATFVLSGVLAGAAQAARAAQLERAWALLDDQRDDRNLDSLCGIFGPGYFRKKLEQAIAEAEHGSGAFSLLIYEPLGLAELGARFGRETADSVVRQIAAELRALAGHTDVLARLEGGRFGILMSHPPRTSPEQVADRLARLSLCDAEGKDVWSLKGQTSLTEWRPDQAPEDILRLALGETALREGEA